MSAKPDFVIAGGQQDGKFVLIASRRLEDVEITEKREYLDEWRRYGYKLLAYEKIDIKASVHDYVVIAADSYAQAWSDLFAQWSPEPDEAREISPSQPAISDRSRAELERGEQ